MIDVLVIGGGVAGLSAAAHIAPHASVVLLEAEPALGYHASGRSAAMYEPNYGSETVKALSRASEAYLRETHGGYLSQRGLMLLAAAGDDAKFDADVKALACDEVSVQDAADRIPVLNTDHVTRAAYHDVGEDIDTDRLLQDFAKDIRAAGGAIHIYKPVTGIAKSETGWSVNAGDDVFHARTIVNAAGPWADDIASLAGIAPLGLQPLRRSMARIAAPGWQDVSDWPMFFGVGESWYAKPDAGQLIVSPAEEDPVSAMDAWPEDHVIAEGFARYQPFVTEEVTRPTATWAGLRTFAPDRTLVLGAEPDAPGFVWSAGQGGYGFQTGPAAGALVADAALGRKPSLPAEIVAALSPARFR